MKHFKIYLQVLLLIVSALACTVQSEVPTIAVTPTLQQGTTLPPTVAATATAPRLVKMFLIALADNGKLGKKIGCDDSVVSVDVAIPPTASSVLRVALESLLAVKTRTYGPKGFTSAIYNSNLKLDNLIVTNNGKATILLTGTLSLSEVCDYPRVQAQFEETAKQFSTIKDVEILINGKALSAYR